MIFLKRKIFLLIISLLFLVLPIIYNFVDATGFRWTQSRWFYEDISSYAEHSQNQDNWENFSYKDDNIKINSHGKITLNNSSQVWLTTTAQDFSEAEMTNNMAISSVNDGEISPKRPAGYDCLENSDCSDYVCMKCGIADCDTNLIHKCYPKWTGAPDVFIASSTVCPNPEEVLGHLELYNEDYYERPDKDGGNISYPALQYFCDAQGARMASPNEIKCMFVNNAHYNIYERGYVYQLYGHYTNGSGAGAWAKTILYIISLPTLEMKTKERFINYASSQRHFAYSNGTPLCVR